MGESSLSSRSASVLEDFRGSLCASLDMSSSLGYLERTHQKSQKKTLSQFFGVLRGISVPGPTGKKMNSSKSHVGWLVYLDETSMVYACSTVSNL